MRLFLVTKMIKLLPLSKGCQNAIRTLVYFSTKPAGTVFSRAEASSETRVPTLFLAKILQMLTRAGILRSHLGAQRGYSLVRSADEVSLWDVVRAYDGPVDDTVCVLDGSKHCPGDATCALHNYWLEVRQGVVTKLASTSVAEAARLMRSRRNGRPRKTKNREPQL